MNITVLGDGGWGTTLAILLSQKGNKVTLWGNFPDYIERLRAIRENEKFLPGIRLPKEMALTHSIEEALQDAELTVAAIPVVYLRATMEKIAPYRPHPVVSIAKGIENKTLLLASQVIADVIGDVPMATLLGPSHAEEVARGLPTSVVASSADMALAEKVQAVFMTERFRVYTNPDTLGAELGAALKNVIAIASGICDGLGFGDNSKAALITRGLAEISRLGVAMGADQRTFAGLTGLGDLITTCVSPYGRNRAVGEAIGKGKTLKQVLDGMEQVAEGVWTTRAACVLAEKHGVEMPIAEQVHEVLFHDKPPPQAVSDLMLRDAKAEA
ncbi:MAG: NAD(P)-dependent glycerol-3-phosphate dehydrogenase [Planctomycetes bacterium]|nr:NAD(P)-dependent glycerol-3-phosphate dehydrogenase [Planctomycetota bacterium]